MIEGIEGTGKVDSFHRCHYYLFICMYLVMAYPKA